jgi:hypothetical protein
MPTEDDPLRERIAGLEAQLAAATAAASGPWRPSVAYRPRLARDGAVWCALYGMNIQEGIGGFGATPEGAMADFDRAWFAATPAARTGAGRSAPPVVDALQPPSVIDNLPSVMVRIVSAIIEDRGGIRHRALELLEVHRRRAAAEGAVEVVHALGELEAAIQGIDVGADLLPVVLRPEG